MSTLNTHHRSILLFVPLNRDQDPLLHLSAKALWKTDLKFPHWEWHHIVLSQQENWRNSMNDLHKSLVRHYNELNSKSHTLGIGPSLAEVHRQTGASSAGG